MKYAIAAGGAAVVIALLGPARPAAACSCAGQVSIHPADAATDVALDAAVILVSDELPNVQVHLRLTGQTADLAAVTELHDRWALVRPAQALTASTSYTIELDSFGGVLQTTTFVTGTTTTTPALAYAGITSFGPETMAYPVPDGSGGTCVSSCVEGASSGHVSRIRLGLAAPPAGAVVVTARVLDGTTHAVLTETALADTTATSAVMGFEGCDVLAPFLEPAGSYCAEVIAYDAAGHAVGDAVELCSAATVCAPALSTTEQCTPADTCDPVPPGTTPDAGTSGASGGGGGCAAAQDAQGLLLAAGLLSLVSARRRRRRSYCKLGA